MADNFLTRLSDSFLPPDQRGRVQRDRLENQLIRDRLSSEKQQRASLTEITGLLGSGTPASEIPPGLLGGVDPGGLIKGVLGQVFPSQERAAPSDIRALRAIGIDPASEEGREIILKRLMGQNSSDDLLKRVELQLKSLQLESERDKIKERNETKDQEFRSTAVALKADLRNVAELAKLNDALEGTSLQTGTPFQDIRRSSAEGLNEVMEIFGVDRSQARKIVSQRDAFNKLSNNFLINSSARFGSGTLTNQKLSTLRDSMAGVGITPGANRVILADTLEALLDAAEIKGVTINNAKELRALADRLRKKAGLLEAGDNLSAADEEELRQREILEGQGGGQ